jgi:hypothetical protein
MTITKGTESAQKILVWVTLVMATIYSLAYYFLLRFWPPPSPSLTAAQVVALYAQHNIEFRFGVFIMIVSGAFYLPWAVVLSIQMAHEEKGLPVWAITQALASTIGTFLFAFPPVLWGVAAFSVDRDPGLTVMMNDFAWLTFVTPSSFFPFQILPIAAVAFSVKADEVNTAFPRWLGWVMVWVAITGTSGAIAQLFKSGPFAWNGLVPFYIPVGIFGGWFCVQAYYLLKAIGYQERIAAGG